MELRILEAGDLVFDAPFGEGEDRHVHVRAASSLARLGEAWIVAQDDSNFAAVWRDAGITPLRLFPFEGADTFGERRGNKGRKPDIECIARLALDGEEVAVCLGSGSTRARRRAAIVRVAAAKFSVSVAPLDSLYEAIEAAVGLAADELNLESACAAGASVRFFQRGNAGRNGFFDVDASALGEALLGRAEVDPRHVGGWVPVTIGALDGAPLGFTATDVARDGRLVFAAAAEATASTYDDGEVKGSAIGLLEGDRVTSLARVPGPPVKIEGLAIESHSPLVVRAVTDADDASRPARWLRIEITP